MKSLIFATILFLPFLAVSQNLPACDSVVIDCCSYNTCNSNSVDIEVSNYSSNIFSYPGFILFDLDMDTVAKETVNYFGIGWNQIHSLNILQPFDLPFEGFLELHTGFYNSHDCSFAIVIPDTTQTTVYSKELDEVLIYPNPASEFLTTDINENSQAYWLQISDLNGKILKDLLVSDKYNLDISNIDSGIYIVTLTANTGIFERIKLVKK